MAGKKTIKKTYMIINNSTGLFSSGGSNPRFNNKGKSWTSIGALKNHLKLVNSSYRDRNTIVETYRDCDVIEFVYEITEKNIAPSEISAFSYGQEQLISDMERDVIRIK